MQKRQTIDYDNIPAKALGKKLLEIGPGSGQAQLASQHGDYFSRLGSNWIAIEKERFEKKVPYVHVWKRIEDIPTGHYFGIEFDTIIMSNLLEHVDLRDWQDTMAKVTNWLKPGGYLIITVPYKENYLPAFQVYRPADLDHAVYRINKKLMKYFLPDYGKIKFRIFNRWVWKDAHETHLWALGRFLKRAIKGHYFVQDYLPRRKMLMVIWKNER